MVDLKLILMENTLSLLSAEGRFKSNETGVSRLVKKGVGQGTAQRILEGKTSVGLETVEQLSDLLGVSPWRLLQPQSLHDKRELNGNEVSTGLSPKSLELARAIDLLPASERAALKTIVNSLLPASKHRSS